MAVSITIGSTIIDFPSSAQEQNWAPNVIEFAQAVEDALSALIGPFDIGVRIMNIDDYAADASPGFIQVTDAVKPLEFPTATFPGLGVRSAIVTYAVYRKTSLETRTETGTLTLLYNDSNTWEIQRDYIGDANCYFQVTSSGRVEIKLDALTGTDVNGRVTYQAKALVQA